MMYWKSTITGQIYATYFIPKGVGWELSTKEEFEQWKKENNL